MNRGKVKFIQGNSYALSSQPFADGSIYLTTDEGKFYIDAYNANEQEERFLINKDKILFNTKEGWDSNISIIAQRGYIYVYTDYRQLEDGTIIPGIKVGDGNAFLFDKPFLDAGYMEHISNADIHITPQERAKWNDKVSCFLDADNQNLLVFTTN